MPLHHRARYIPACRDLTCGFPGALHTGMFTGWVRGYDFQTFYCQAVGSYHFHRTRWLMDPREGQVHSWRSHRLTPQQIHPSDSNNRLDGGPSSLDAAELWRDRDGNRSPLSRRSQELLESQIRRSADIVKSRRGASVQTGPLQKIITHLSAATCGEHSVCMLPESDCLLSPAKPSDKDSTPRLPRLMCSLKAAHLDEEQTKWSHANSLSFTE